MDTGSPVLTLGTFSRGVVLATMLGAAGLAVVAPVRAQASPVHTSTAAAQLSVRAAESAGHLRDIRQLAGPAPTSAIAADVEQKALQAGARFAPTPFGLGSEGCMAAISQYVLQPVARDFGLHVPTFRSSNEFLEWSRAHPETVHVTSHFIDQFSVHDLQPGDIVVGVKGDGNHVMAMTRVPADWQWNPNDLMAVGNTGLAEFGPPAMRLAQEYIGPGLLPGEPEHNAHHGMMNSDSPNNPYRYGNGGTFYVVRFVSNR